MLVANQRDWTAAQVVQAYGGQQHVERVFRGLKGSHWLDWGPMHHWTDDKIRVHAFTCLLGVSLLQRVRQRAVKIWPSLSREELKQQLAGIQQVELLYPRQGAATGGKHRIETDLSAASLGRGTRFAGVDRQPRQAAWAMHDAAA